MLYLASIQAQVQLIIATLPLAPSPVFPLCSRWARLHVEWVTLQRPTAKGPTWGGALLVLRVMLPAAFLVQQLMMLFLYRRVHSSMQYSLF